MPVLTQKQENFTINLFQGMSQREAYVQAGYSHKSSPYVLDTRACELAKNGNIRLRLAELNKKREDAAKTTVEERKRILSQFQG